MNSSLVATGWGSLGRCDVHDCIAHLPTWNGPCYNELWLSLVVLSTRCFIPSRKLRNMLTHHICACECVYDNIRAWRFPRYRNFVRGIPLVYCPHKSIDVGFGVFVDVCPNELLNKTLSRWFETPWLSCNVTVMLCSYMYIHMYTERGSNHFRIEIGCIILSSRIECNYNSHRMKSLHGNAFSIFGRLWGENHRSQLNFPHKGPVVQRFDIFFDVSLNKQLIKYLRERWIKMAWRTVDVTVMRNSTELDKCFIWTWLWIPLPNLELIPAA